ncbi:hypothetical protein B0H14DRAFT_2609927 [Mycena olivaceomarginata]|nr:hypothetical protein B0H14DRAFT_2609927 [Mycena olivaceomarginata]
MRVRSHLSYPSNAHSRLCYTPTRLASSEVDDECLIGRWRRAEVVVCGSSGAGGSGESGEAQGSSVSRSASPGFSISVQILEVPAGLVTMEKPASRHFSRSMNV